MLNKLSSQPQSSFWCRSSKKGKADLCALFTDLKSRSDPEDKQTLNFSAEKTETQKAEVIFPRLAQGEERTTPTAHLFFL